MGAVVNLADFRKPAPRVPLPALLDDLDEIIAWLQPAEDWWTGQMQIEHAYHFYRMTDVRRILVGAKFGKGSDEHNLSREQAETAFQAWRTQGLKQMFIPAPTLRHLRWKQEWMRKNRGAGCREIGFAIARDEKALARRIAAVARQQAGKAARKAVLP